MLVMDSGLGGISIVRAMRVLAPQLPLAYLSDTAGFPYGNRTVDDITARAIAALQAAGTMIDFTTVVLACNTLSTYTPNPDSEATNSEKFPDAYGFGHWPFYRDVIADIQSSRPHPIAFAEGRRAIRLLNALYRSAEDKGEVRVDDGLSSRMLGRPDARLTALYHTPVPAISPRL